MKLISLALLLIVILMAATCYAIGPAMFTVHLIAHDGAGRTLQATAKGNSLKFDNQVLTVDYSTDSVLCSAFGG